MKVGDLVKWTGDIWDGESMAILGLVEFVCDRYIYVRWADGVLDEYEVEDWKSKRLDLEVIS